jgi:hypothetical protein
MSAIGEKFVLPQFRGSPPTATSASNAVDFSHAIAQCVEQNGIGGGYTQMHMENDIDCSFIPGNYIVFVESDGDRVYLDGMPSNRDLHSRLGEGIPSLRLANSSQLEEYIFAIVVYVDPGTRPIAFGFVPLRGRDVGRRGLRFYVSLCEREKVLMLSLQNAQRKGKTVQFVQGLDPEELHCLLGESCVLRGQEGERYILPYTGETVEEPSCIRSVEVGYNEYTRLPHITRINLV